MAIWLHLPHRAQTFNMNSIDCICWAKDGHTATLISPNQDGTFEEIECEHFADIAVLRKFVERECGAEAPAPIPQGDPASEELSAG